VSPRRNPLTALTKEGCRRTFFSCGSHCERCERCERCEWSLTRILTDRPFDFQISGRRKKNLPMRPPRLPPPAGAFSPPPPRFDHHSSRDRGPSRAELHTYFRSRSEHDASSTACLPSRLGTDAPSGEATIRARSSPAGWMASMVRVIPLEADACRSAIPAALRAMQGCAGNSRKP
jgi:hypothetical protein